MRRFQRAIAVLVIAGCSGPGRGLAPIRLEPLSSFGDDSGDGAIAADPRISRLHSRGYRIVISGGGGVSALPLVYTDSGRFVGTLHGGESAAEQFQVPLFARVGPGDSVWIFDGAQRVLVFGPDRRYVRTAQLPVSPWDAVVLPDGRMVIAPANADHPLPLLLLSPAGDRIHELGGEDSAAATIRSPRWLAQDTDGSFWSMPTQFAWRLEHWDSGGALMSAVDRRPTWFAPYFRVSTPGRDTAPQPTITGMWIDHGRRLWVLGIAADPHWQRGLAAHRPGSSGSVIVNPDELYDTILEAIDLRTAKLVATTRVDPAYSSEASPGVIVRIRATPRGWKHVELTRVVLDHGLSK